MLYFFSLILLLTYAGLILYYLRGFSRLKKEGHIKQEQHSKITVLVPFRNERKNISALIDSLKNQTYSSNCIEYLFIDDFSEDDTDLEIKKLLENTLTHYRILYLKNNVRNEFSSNTNNKKKAIELGVEAASNECILITDADCVAPNSWIQETVNNLYFDKNNIVLGAVRYPKSTSFFSAFLEIDQLNNISIAASTVLLKKPTMANGGNLAFRKSIFKAVHGFSGLHHIPSGDDMQLLHRFYGFDKTKIGVCFLENATVYTEAPKTFNSFLQQRLRWFSKNHQYELSYLKYQLWIGFAANLLCVLAMIFSFYNPIFSVFFLIKMAIDTLFLFPVLKFFKRINLIIFLPLFEVVYAWYVVGFGIVSIFVGFSWKNVQHKKQ